MFIDNLTLMLICVSASFLTIAGYLLCGLHKDEGQGSWAAVFGILGIVLLASGFHVTWEWPLPGAFNVAYGEPCVLLGALMIGASISIYNGWSLIPLAIPAFLFGGASLVIAFGIYQLHLSKEPLMTAFGFAISGVGGVFAFTPLVFPKQKIFKYVGALDMIGSGLLWAATAFMSYYAHLQGFGKWLPPGMKPM